MTKSLAGAILTYDQRDIALSPYGAYWRQLKKICILELLSAKRVQSFRSNREEELSKMIESISAKAGELINLSEMIFALTNIILRRAAFGAKCKDQREIISAFKEVVEVFRGFSVADLYPSLRWVHVLSGETPKIERLHKRLDMMLEAIIGVHKACRVRKEKRDGEAEEDLIDVLLRIQEQSAVDLTLTNEDVKAVCIGWYSTALPDLTVNIFHALEFLYLITKKMKPKTFSFKHNSKNGIPQKVNKERSIS
ncbi:Cytochrome P450 [Dillenia turbinata]|uniref:Cytochrome P450 n=1 Tax=Dillenia turbinata TaxID=194707 RepID=A0AAN8VUY9_9MAGN